MEEEMQGRCSGSGQETDKLRECRLFIGRKIEKVFGGKWFLGNIESHDIDAHTGERIWFVRYDDGDSEDLNFGELQRALLQFEILSCKNVATQNADRGKRRARRNGRVLS